MSIDADGKVHATGDLEKYLGEEFDIENTIEMNDLEKGRLKGETKKEEKKKTKKKENENEKKDEETQEIEENLDEKGQELELTHIRKIKDVQNLKDRMPEAFSDSDEYAHAYSKKLGKFVILENKKDGDKSKWQLNDKIEPAKSTQKKIISIDEDGKNIEKEVPYALMKTNRDDKEIAVSYGQYGEINVQTVDVLPCQARVARQVREQGEGEKGREDAQLTREFKAGGKEYTHKLAHEVQEIEEIQKESNQTTDYQITEEEYIPNTKTKWKELMEDTGESLPELIERYNRDISKSKGQVDSKTIVDNIRDDYEMVSHEHKH